jgi:transcriptional regulator with XRE-family HTH domain
MNHQAQDKGWTAHMADLEGNSVVSVGGLAAKLAALERQERRPELQALGKLVELRRRERGLSVSELLRKADLTEAALAYLEEGVRMPNTRDVIYFVAPVLDLPAEKLLAVAGLTDVADPALSSAALRFAAEANAADRLSPSERLALGEFLKALTAA